MINIIHKKLTIISIRETRGKMNWNINKLNTPPLKYIFFIHKLCQMRKFTYWFDRYQNLWGITLEIIFKSTPESWHEAVCDQKANIYIYIYSQSRHFLSNPKWFTSKECYRHIVWILLESSHSIKTFLSFSNSLWLTDPWRKTLKF